MRVAVWLSLLLLSTPLFAQVAELKPREGAKACYLGFIDLFRATYLVSADAQTRCVQLDYLRGFDAEDLAEHTRDAYRDIHAGVHVQDDEQLQRFVEAFETVRAGDRYRYCVSDIQGGELFFNGEPVLQMENVGFSQRLFRIWVAGGDDQGRVRWNFSPCASWLEG